MEIYRNNEEATIFVTPRHVWTEYTTIIQARVPISLRAQLVRHRNLHFVDNFYYQLTEPDILLADLSWHVEMEISAPNDVWKSVISKRSCWIAQADLWKPILDKFDEGFLPCADGKCPYVKDAELRFTDADPGVPCPRYANLYHKDKGPWLPAMTQEAKARGSFWEEEVAQ